MMECQKAKTLDEEVAAMKNCQREFPELDQVCDLTMSTFAFMGF